MRLGRYALQRTERKGESVGMDCGEIFNTYTNVYWTESFYNFSAIRLSSSNTISPYFQIHRLGILS